MPGDGRAKIPMGLKDDRGKKIGCGACAAVFYHTPLPALKAVLYGERCTEGESFASLPISFKRGTFSGPYYISL